jgi:pimeloyl-ACP methyl ester carboxylesterase
VQTDAIVLVHAGIADNRMWDPIEPLLAEGFEVRRHELRGFGDTALPAGHFSHEEDLEATLARPVALVGSSFGGFVALSVAARRPDLVAALVLMDAPLHDHEWSAEMQQYFAEEEERLEAGDLDGAVELNVRFWAGHADPAVRELVATMVRRGIELQADAAPQDDEPDPVQLGELRVPLLVLVGAHDKPDFRAIAQRLEAEVPGARLAVIDDAGHLPALERPSETAAAVLEFLGESLDPAAETPADHDGG